MKRIKKYTYSSKEKIKTFEIEVKLSSDFKVYFSGQEIPEELQKSYSGTLLKVNKFEDFDQLNKKIQGIIADFEATFITETKKKVIIYMIEYENDHCGQRMIFRYMVCYRIDSNSTKGTKTVYYEERTIRSSSGGDLHQTRLDEINIYGWGNAHNDPVEMAWTPERELWFQKMEEGINQLGQNLLEGFGERAEILAKKIDQGMLNTLLLNAATGDNE